ncbi:DUF192 domain-containing protein [Thetidibacter halocola]|uniref:DUF192 domain-containing protein n=1 Tax=Thetidibacter halocola TaxID=2827239 RepID=A0A8J7W8D1_9RHOB|nr:DUF192 domain-containing protein [Thetidibacter halocola]MBS0122765.1 DUF192 domain-containing protein [Thetidibacter halocola]
MGIRLAALTFVVCFATGAAADEVCRDDTLWLRGDFGTARFSVSIADDAEERARGLMFVETMPTSNGMLFVYDVARPVAFWMKNTLIPLDILFADDTGTVIRVHENAIPGDLTGLPSGGPAQYVLEINGGLARQMGIGPGAQMRHPSIDEPAWPC